MLGLYTLQEVDKLNINKAQDKELKQLTDARDTIQNQICGSKCSLCVQKGPNTVAAISQDTSMSFVGIWSLEDKSNRMQLRNLPLLKTRMSKIKTVGR